MRRYNEEFNIPVGKGDYEYHEMFEDWLVENFSEEFADAWWEMDEDFVNNILLDSFDKWLEEQC